MEIRVTSTRRIKSSGSPRLRVGESSEGCNLRGLSGGAASRVAFFLDLKTLMADTPRMNCAIGPSSLA